MPDVKDFPHPIGVDIEEEVPVKKIKFDIETGKTFTTYDLEKVKVRYLDIPYEKYRCKNGEHIFKSVDIHRYIFSCKNCSYSRQVYPTTYKFLDGKLIHRITGKVV